MHKGFEDLKRIWYAKIKEANPDWRDVETEDGSSLKEWDSHNFSKKSKEHIHQTMQLTQDYYLRANELLNSYSFDNPTHKRIWELHSSGLSKRKIEPLISNMNPSYKREQIGNIIKIIEGAIV